VLGFESQARDVITVNTENSTYLLDLEEMNVRRIPGDGPYSGPLRRDDETLTLVELPVPPQVGESMVMVLQIRDDGVVTIRRTSPVISIHCELPCKCACALSLADGL
jgi:hypothetical protein